MAATIFDIGIRTLECGQCGAPIAAPREGGHVRCEYCGAANDVATRAADARARRETSMADEVARLARLKSQLANPVSGHIYDLRREPLGWAGVDPASPGGFDRLSKIWGQSKAIAESERGPEEDRALCWAAMRLADAHRVAGNSLRARATLETALDRLADTGLRHMVRCRLASEAVREGDLVSAEGWLEECDAAPEVLELDSAYREASARLHTAQRRFTRVLEVIGREPQDIPIHPVFDLQVSALRIHALEMVGMHPQAAAAEAQAAAAHGAQTVLATLAADGLAPDVLRKRAAEAREQLRATLDGLGRQRTLLSTGARALPSGTIKLPLIALALLALIAVPRCSADIDPLLGVQGYLLCPKVCEGCTGPTLVHTQWTSHGGGEYSTNGAEFYCRPPDGVPGAGPREMSSVAAIASSYVVLVLVLLPLLPLFVWRTHRKAAAARDDLDRQIYRIAHQLGDPPPRLTAPPSFGGCLVALAILGVAVALPILITLVAL